MAQARDFLPKAALEPIRSNSFKKSDKYELQSLQGLADRYRFQSREIPLALAAMQRKNGLLNNLCNRSTRFCVLR